MHPSFSKNSKRAIPLHATTAERLEELVAKLPARASAYLKAVGFVGAEGDLRLVPDADGSLACAVLGLGKGLDPLALAVFGEQLPPGVYTFATLPSEQDPSLAALGFALGTYAFSRYRKKKTTSPQLVPPKEIDAEAVSRIADAVCFARDMINTPANDMGPEEIASAARAVAKRHRAPLSVTTGQALKQANFPLIHAVGSGSEREPRLIDFSWGRKSAPKLTLVGKGVCFDTGGYDLKPSSAMLTMKKDMGGAAIVLALADLIMAAKLNVRLRVLIPAVENSVSGRAYRPGDVFPSRQGLTVEVGNTDAEGRLVLADALTEADGDAPDLLIDVATLTGAARVATGMEIPPFFTDDENLAAELMRHAKQTHDPLWRLPLWRGYEPTLSSAVADITNNPDYGYAGAITAALFLNRFVINAKSWVHLDVAAWTDRPKPGRRRGAEANALRALYALVKSRYGEA